MALQIFRIRYHSKMGKGSSLGIERCTNKRTEQIAKTALLIQSNQQDRFYMIYPGAYYLQATCSLAENKTNRFSSLVIKSLSKGK